MNDKACNKCWLRKPLEDFHKLTTSKDGRQASCKSCRRTYAEAWNAANKEKERARKAIWYIANTEKDKIRSAAWKAANLERVKARNAAWAIVNRGKRNSAHARRRAAKKRATPPWLTAEQRQQIVAIYEACPKGYHVDHIIPLTSDIVCGLHVPWNLQILPASENISKGNKFNQEKYNGFA
jgi:hypothetical protein